MATDNGPQSETITQAEADQLVDKVYKSIGNRSRRCLGAAAVGAGISLLSLIGQSIESLKQASQNPQFHEGLNYALNTTYRASALATIVCIGISLAYLRKAGNILREYTSDPVQYMELHHNRQLIR